MDLRDWLQAIALSTLAFAPIALGMLLGTRNGLRRGLRNNAVRPFLTSSQYAFAVAMELSLIHI